MIFYSRNFSTIRDKAKRNYFVFTKDGWNDYWEFKTLYYLEYIDNEGNRFSVGHVKILEKENGHTELPDSFEELEERFASLGQDLSYYQNLQNYFPENYEEILSALNDLAFNPSVYEEFEEENGLRVSLLRNSEAEKNLNQAKKILNGIDFESNFNFSYSCLLPGAEKKHEIGFHFDIDSELPYRIISIMIIRKHT
jgi:hypothetical protein